MLFSTWSFPFYLDRENLRHLLPSKFCRKVLKFFWLMHDYLWENFWTWIATCDFLARTVYVLIFANKCYLRKIFVVFMDWLWKLNAYLVDFFKTFTFCFSKIFLKNVKELYIFTLVHLILIFNIELWSLISSLIFSFFILIFRIKFSLIFYTDVMTKLFLDKNENFMLESLKFFITKHLKIFHFSKKSFMVMA